MCCRGHWPFRLFRLFRGYSAYKVPKRFVGLFCGCHHDLVISMEGLVLTCSEQKTVSVDICREIQHALHKVQGILVSTTAPDTRYDACLQVPVGTNYCCLSLSAQELRACAESIANTMPIHVLVHCRFRTL